MSALTYVIIAGVFVAVLAVLKLLLPLILGGGGETGALPYESKGTLVTPAERSFLEVLDQVVGQHYRIMAQVRVADVISVKRGWTSSRGVGRSERSRRSTSTSLRATRTICRFSLPWSWTTPVTREKTAENETSFSTRRCRRRGFLFTVSPQRNHTTRRRSIPRYSGEADW
jgi:hypothetical protein